jgi:hypothetical protein
MSNLKILRAWKTRGRKEKAKAMLGLKKQNKVVLQGEGASIYSIPPICPKIMVLLPRVIFMEPRGEYKQCGL